MTEALMAQGIAKSPNYGTVEGPATNLAAAEEELDRQIVRLNELVSELGVKLERITRQANADIDPPIYGSIEMDSDVSRMVMSSANRVRMVCNRLENIYGRVDL